MWSDKAGLLTWSHGCLVLIREWLSLYVGSHLCMWAVIFVHWRSSLCMGSRVHVGALVLYVHGCLRMGAGGCGCGHECGCVAVVKGCGGGSGHGLWLSRHRCGCVVDTVDVVVVRGHVIVLVR